MDYIASLQPNQPGVRLGDYDVSRPLPYPFHVRDDLHVENVPGYPLQPRDQPSSALPKLIGFQHEAEVQVVDLYAEDWRADPTEATGMFPVFVGPDGDMFNLTTPIKSVTS